MNLATLQQHPRAVGCLVAIATLPLMFGPIAQAQDWSTIEQNIVIEQNNVRQNPQSYIPLLEAYLASMDTNGNIPNGCGHNCTMLTQEGQAAVEEAIAFLRNQPALAPITLSPSAARAAKEHAQDQVGGATGHTGSDGSSPIDRIRRNVTGNIRGTGENIAYGSMTGQEVVMDLIIDDGVPSRGHRTNIFDPDWTHVGAGCGPHATYNTTCVINYFTEQQGGSSSNSGNSGPISTPSSVNNQFTVVHNGTVELQSLQIGGANILDGPLAPGQSRDIPLSSDQCEADLRIQLESGYNPLDWTGLSLCGSTFTINSDNGFDLEYWQLL